ncbi:MAG: hypothetical protein ACI9H1_001514 [Polaribacter sp.]|jgi:hypothetical protein
MTINIKKIKYLIPPKDLFNDALDVFITLEDDYCSDGFCYFVEITTPQFLSTIMEKGKSTFLEPGYPYIIVSKLTDDIIRAAIESLINPKDYPDEDELRWLRFYHVIPKLTTEEIDEILNRKKEEEIELDAAIDAEFEDE